MWIKFNVSEVGPGDITGGFVGDNRTGRIGQRSEVDRKHFTFVIVHL